MMFLVSLRPHIIASFTVWSVRKILRNTIIYFVTYLYCVYPESIAYEFGPSRGTITYTFPPSSVADTETDKVALGFVTSKADAVLLKIESSNTQDYMQMEIVSEAGKSSTKS